MVVYFSHIPQPKRDKLEKKAKFGIFISYSLPQKLIELSNHKH
ncbi:hypothetical protein, partial [Shigella sonnei]